MKKTRHLPVIILFIFWCTNHLAAQTITTVAGDGSYGFSGGDGIPATASGVYWPWGVAADENGNFYISDRDNHRVRKVDVAGIIHTIAGDGISGFFGDGGPATLAKIAGPIGIAVDHAGNVYFADQDNDCIRMIDNLGTISTIAGVPGTPGYTGDHGAATAAQISAGGVCIDKKGNIYFTSNNITYSGFTIRKIDTNRIITTIAGSNGISGFSGDGGPATAALLNDPNDVIVDTKGNLYILDRGNARIRKIDTLGIITTIAGTGTSGYSGDGIAATTANISGYGGLAINDAGEIFIGDYSNSCVRKIDGLGIITTIAGTPGVGGHTGDGGPATAAELGLPNKVAVDDCGNIYVTDLSEMDVRKISGANYPASFVHGHTVSFSLCRDSSASVTVDSILAVIDSNLNHLATWTVLIHPTHGSITGGNTAYTTGGSIIMPPGLSYAPTIGYAGNDSFSVIITDCDHSADTAMVQVVVHTYTEKVNFLTRDIKETIRVYPNPAYGRVVLCLTSSLMEDVQFTISNMLGEKVKEFISTTNSPAEIQLNLNPGIYFINAVTAHGSNCEKLILKDK